jgi:hypothetical protein
VQTWTRKGKGYAVLTLCRLLYALETVRQPSKRLAAEWAAGRWPDLAPMILAAMDRRRDPSDEQDVPADFPERLQRLMGLAATAAGTP